MCAGRVCTAREQQGSVVLTDTEAARARLVPGAAVAREAGVRRPAAVRAPERSARALRDCNTRHLLPHLLLSTKFTYIPRPQ